MPFFVASSPSDLIPMISLTPTSLRYSKTELNSSAPLQGLVGGHIMVTRRCVGPMLVTAHCFACHVTRK